MKKLLLSVSLFTCLYAAKAQSPLCFGTQIDKNFGYYGNYLASADFNSDGNKDVALSVYSNSTIWWFMGNGNGTFGTGNYTSTGGNPSGIALGDFNGDTKPDIVTNLFAANTFMILLNNGAGSFTPGSSFPTRTYPNCVVTGDFNNDAKTDVVVGYYSIDSISLYLGNGAGGFSAGVKFHAYSSPQNIAVGDFNGDSNKDIAVASNTGNNVSILLGSGTGTFSNPSYISTFGSGSTGITVNDFNNDTYSDIAVCNSSTNDISVMMGDGTGSFTSGSLYAVSGVSPSGITSADYDADGKIDVAVSCGSNGNVCVMLGNDLGAFTPNNVINASSGVSGIITADYDNDTKPDLGLANSGNNSVTVLPSRIKPTVTSLISAPTVCAAVSDTIRALGTGTTYNLMPGNVNSPDTFFVNPAVTTFYTIVATDALTGCTNTDTFTVYVNANPTVTATPDITLCNGQSSGMSSSGATTYSWLPVTGLNNPALASPLATPLVTTNYTVTGTDANGCIGSDSVLITINPLPSVMAPPDQNLCTGDSVMLNASGALSYSWSPVSYLNSAAIPAPYCSAAVTTTYTVTGTDVNGCTNSDAVTVNVFALPPVTAGASALSSCPGVNDTLMGAGAITYSWSPIGSALASPVVNPTVTTTYTLTGTDAMGCVNTATVNITINVNNNITGVILDTLNNNVAAGSAYLFARNPNNPGGALDSVDMVPISSGSYIFMNVNVGNYIVKAIADTSLAAYATAVPTYYNPSNPNAFQWDSAQVINNATCTGASISGIDIHVIQIPALSGPGIISGLVVEGSGFGTRWIGGPDHIMVPGGPIRGVDVKLGKNPGGSAAARTMTDSLGHYTFTNIPLGSYRIYVDIPNYGMDSVLDVSISAGNTNSANNNYYVDSSMVRVDSVQATGIKHITEVKEGLLVYPNPTAGIIYLDAKEIIGSVEVYNIMGDCVHKEKIGTNKGRVDISKQAPGIYFIHTANSRVRVVKE